MAGVYVSSTQVAASVPFDNTITSAGDNLVSTNAQVVILEFRLNYLIAMINTSSRLIKTQRVMAETVLRGQK